MRFQVPQFIDVEDKIFGPLTIKQFVYLAGGAGMAYIVYTLVNIILPTFISIIFMIPVVALAVALAFYKVNKKPFIFFLENALRYFIGSKLYIWKKEEKKVVQQQKEGEEDALLYVPKLSNSKLKDLTWSLDIKESANLGAKETMEQK